MTHENAVVSLVPFNSCSFYSHFDRRVFFEIKLNGFYLGIREFNKLNVPTYDRKHQVKAKELICQAVELLHELVTAMSNFHTYTEQVWQKRLILITSMITIMTFMHFLYSLCFQRLKIVFVESNQQQLSPATQKVW